jgi:hypothetical protein
VLTQIRVQVSGGTFDAGNFNIFYE